MKIADDGFGRNLSHFPIVLDIHLCRGFETNTYRVERVEWKMPAERRKMHWKLSNEVRLRKLVKAF